MARRSASLRSCNQDTRGVNISDYVIKISIRVVSIPFDLRTNSDFRSRSFGKWSLGLMPLGLKSFGLIQLVYWLNFLKPSVPGIGHLA